MSAPLNDALAARLRRVKLFLCDVDGVLTDASVFISEHTETKRFNINDGLGLKMLQKHGIQVGWISNRPSTATTKRATELKVDFLIQKSAGNKVEAAQELLQQTGLTWDEVSYAGDDVVDLALMKKTGVAFGLANGIPETKAVAHYVTEAKGGDGAIREMVHLILQAQGLWEKILQENTFHG